MKKPPGVRIARRANGVAYYFQKRIPPDLRETFPQFAKRGLIEQRLPDDRDEAYREAARLWFEYEDEFKRRAAPQGLEEIGRRLARASSRLALQADQEARDEGDLADPDPWNRHRLQQARLEQEAREVVARGRVGEWLANALEDWYGADQAQLPARLQKPYDTLTPRDRLTLARAFAQETLDRLRIVQRRDAGDVVPTPSEARPSGLTLSDVIDYWAKTGSAKREKSVEEARAVARRFEALVGERPVERIAKKDAIAYRDARRDGGVSWATVKKDISLLRAVFEVAVKDEWQGLTVNPFDRIRVENGEPVKPRRPFTPDELKALFALPIFTKGERPQGGGGEAAFWLPLLGLYTGARREELLQLRPDDVCTKDGIDYLHFRHDPKTGQMLKTGSAGNKRVPIHPELVRLGFIEYARGQQGSGRLFPAVTSSKAWGKWFARTLDAAGLSDRGLDFHAFRHTFVNALRAANVPEDQRKALTGHASADVHARYGALEGYPLGPLAEAVGRVRSDESSRLVRPFVG